MKVESIIVGHGLAAVAVSEHLRKLNNSFIVISDVNPVSSSRIAAGLYNPITGRKMKQTWLAKELFPYLEGFYEELETSLGGNFLYKKNIYRPFLSMEDQNEWMSKSPDQQENEFIAEMYTKPAHQEYINDEYGGLLLHKSGFLDVKKLLELHQTYLIKLGQFRIGKVEMAGIKIKPSSIQYMDIIAKRIIFCDGPMSNNSFFDWVPTAAVKGEILHIITEKSLPENVIFNKGVFIIKSSQSNYYRVGATYEWKNLNHHPTEKARQQLIEKLDAFLKIPYKIVDQVAGIRPASKDRRPLIGQHPEKDNVFLFNGLGTKGVSLAPYFAKQFCGNLINSEKLNDEVNISRYYPLYSS